MFFVGKKVSQKPKNMDYKLEYERILKAVYDEKLYADMHLDRETFASHMNLSRHTLNKVLSTNTEGLSFPQWMNNIRVQIAGDLLQNDPGKTITKISEEVGLTPDNLRRLYRQKVGVTPSEYRNRKN